MESEWISRRRDITWNTYGTNSAREGTEETIHATVTLTLLNSLVIGGALSIKTRPALHQTKGILCWVPNTLLFITYLTFLKAKEVN
jgi:hypothetical protein